MLGAFCSLRVVLCQNMSDYYWYPNKQYWYALSVLTLWHDWVLWLRCMKDHNIHIERWGYIWTLQKQFPTYHCWNSNCWYLCSKIGLPFIFHLLQKKENQGIMEQFMHCIMTLHAHVMWCNIMTNWCNSLCHKYLNLSILSRDRLQTEPRKVTIAPGSLGKCSQPSLAHKPIEIRNACSQHCSTQGKIC